nr:hypothetical protein [Tanacetum cinerariifolium]
EPTVEDVIREDYVSSREDAKQGEDVDVINVDGFNSDPGNDDETSNYKRRRLAVLSKELEASQGTGPTGPIVELKLGLVDQVVQVIGLKKEEYRFNPKILVKAVQDQLQRHVISELQKLRNICLSFYDFFERVGQPEVSFVVPPTNKLFKAPHHPSFLQLLVSSLDHDTSSILFACTPSSLWQVAPKSNMSTIIRLIRIKQSSIPDHVVSATTIHNPIVR